MIRDLWIPVEKIQHLIQIETFAVLWALLFIAFIFYKFLLKKITAKRHANMRSRFSRTLVYLIITTILAGAHFAVYSDAYRSSNEYLLVKLSNYLSFFALIFGVISVVRIAQIFVYLYLFFANMSVGVPRLIANMFTLAFSLIVVSWIAADVFSFHLAAVLATSAVFSLVLGLALQDTLGNLFSGVALQIDQPFSIGDWVEIHSGSEKWNGQVQEISWRATTLMGFADELILIPNRLIAQSQLINFSHLQKPARLNQVFRFRFDANIPLARKSLLEGLLQVPDVLSDPAPRTLITEVTESWVTLKVFYSLQDYGTKYRTGDVIITNILEQIKKNNLSLATPVLNLVTDESDG